MKNRLKEIRKMRGLSQAELSEKTGLSRTTISKIEANVEANVTMQTIVKISEVLDVPPREIFLF